MFIHPESLDCDYMDTDTESGYIDGGVFLFPLYLFFSFLISTFQLHSLKAGLTDHVIIQNMLQQEAGPSVAPDC